MKIKDRLKFSPERFTQMSVCSISLKREDMEYYARLPLWNFRQVVWLSCNLNPDIKRNSADISVEEAQIQGKSIHCSWKKLFEAVYAGSLRFKVVASPSEGATLYFDPLEVVDPNILPDYPEDLVQLVKEYHVDDFWDPARALARKRQSESNRHEYLLYHYVANLLTDPLCTCTVQSMYTYMYNVSDPDTSSLIYDDSVLTENGLKKIISKLFTDLDLKHRILGYPEYRKQPDCPLHT